MTTARKISSISSWLWVVVIIGVARLIYFVGLKKTAIRILKSCSVRLPTARQELFGEIAYLHEKSGNIDLAIQHLKNAGIPDKEPGFYYCELAYLYEMDGQVEQSISMYKKALDNSDSLGEQFIIWIKERLNSLST